MIELLKYAIAFAIILPLSWFAARFRYQKWKDTSEEPMPEFEDAISRDWGTLELRQIPPDSKRIRISLGYMSFGLFLNILGVLMLSNSQVLALAIAGGIALGLFLGFYPKVLYERFKNQLSKSFMSRYFIEFYDYSPILILLCIPFNLVALACLLSAVIFGVYFGLFVLGRKKKKLESANS